MKIQRILQATFKEERPDEKFQIVLAFTDRNEFVTWQYFKDTKYTSGQYFTNFYAAYDNFVQRCSRNGGAKSTSYYVKQIGETEIVWEEL